MISIVVAKEVVLEGVVGFCSVAEGAEPGVMKLELVVAEVASPETATELVLAFWE